MRAAGARPLTVTFATPPAVCLSVSLFRPALRRPGKMRGFSCTSVEALKRTTFAIGAFTRTR